MPGVRDYAVEHWGLDHDASIEQFSETLTLQVRRGAITREKLLQLQAEDKQAADANLAELRKKFPNYGAPPASKPTNTIPEHSESFSTENPIMEKSAVAAAAFGGGGQVDVKKPSARYSTKSYDAKNKHGEIAYRNGSPIQTATERDHALIGAWFKAKMVAGCPGVGQLTEHEQDLLSELANDHKWVGDAHGVYHTHGVKLSSALQTKGTDFIADATSGGASMVPYWFDSEVVNYPLLAGELAPMVEMKDMPASNDVRLTGMGNVSATWQGNPSEGAGASIPLDATDSLVNLLDNSVFDLVMAITVGRNLIADSPVNVGQEITKRMGMKHAEQIDVAIAMGNGTSQPKGLTNSTGMAAVNAVNGSAGPFTTADVTNLISAVPKQYRNVSDPKVAFVFNDASWFRLRNLQVHPTTDQRLILGYDFKNYTLGDYPVKVNNYLSPTNVFFGKLDLYRLWRRMGLQIESSWQGKTLMLNHEILFTARGRYAGVLTNGAGVAYMANAPLH